MKKHLHLYLIAGFVALSLISGTLYNSSSPGKKTGSPLDGGNTCVQCHSGNEVSSVDWITTNIPATGWVPKETYTITTTAEHAEAKRIGFEITAENNTLKTGTFELTDADRTKLLNNKSAVTHTAAGHVPTDGKNTWTFQWTAPDVDRGDITFYAAYNGADGNNSTSGDQIFKSTLTFKQDPNTTDVLDVAVNPFSVYPNPARNFIYVESPNEILYVNIYSLSGRMVKSLPHLQSKKSKIELESLTPGIYLVKATTSIGEVVQKIQLK